MFLDTLAQNPVLLIALFLVALVLFLISLIWMFSILRKPSAKQLSTQPATVSQMNQTRASPPIEVAVGNSYLQLVDAAGNAWPLEPLPVSIGRDAQRNTIVLVDDRVSASHAIIFFDEIVRAICIEDNNSLNGIFIDDHPTRKNLLHDSVKIKFGETTLTYRDMGYIPPASN